MTALEQIMPDDAPFDLEREPLDQPAGFGIDWGGDGTDPLRTVRTHVLAALTPATGPYAPPLDALLTFGKMSTEELARRGAALGIGQEQVPELLRMARDRALNTRDSDAPEVWAPLHAIDLLKPLDLSAHVSDLMPLFDVDFERVNDELIGIVAGIGAAALDPISAYLADHSRWAWGRSRAASVLEQLAKQQPDLCAPVIERLSALLADTAPDHEIAVTGLVTALVELKAAETLPLIRAAYAAHRVDENVIGPWGDALTEMGGTPDPSDPLVIESAERFRVRDERMFPAGLRENLAAFQARHQAERQQAKQLAAAAQKKQAAARKVRQKRKTASASRKANSKKRK